MGPEWDWDRERERNQVAARRLKPEIDRQYPKGQWVAIWDGQVVADGANLGELHARLEPIVPDPRQVMVVQAGINYPDFVYILSLGDSA